MPDNIDVTTKPEARSHRTGGRRSANNPYRDQNTAAPPRRRQETEASSYVEYTDEEFSQVLDDRKPARRAPAQGRQTVSEPEITPASPRAGQDAATRSAPLPDNGRIDPAAAQASAERNARVYEDVPGAESRSNPSSRPAGSARESGYEADASNLGRDSSTPAKAGSSRSGTAGSSGYRADESNNLQPGSSRASTAASERTEASQRPARAQNAEETARQAKEAAAQQRVANEAQFNRSFRAVSGKDTAASREQKEAWAKEDEQGKVPTTAQTKRGTSKNRKLDVSHYADKEADEKGKIRDLKLGGIYSSSTRISDDSSSFTRKSTVLGGLGQRKETFAIDENGLTSLERTSKTTRNLFRERTVNYAVGGEARTVEVKSRGGLLSRSTEESADGTKFQTGRKVKGFYETKTSELNENGQRVRETKNSFFGIKYGGKTELTDAKGKPIAELSSSFMGSSWKREATADGRIKDTVKGLGLGKSVTRDAHGIAQVSSRTGPLRREQSFVTGEKSGSTVTSMGRLFRSETITPVDGEHKTRKMSLLGVIKWDAKVKMSDKEIAVRDQMKEKRPAMQPQAPKTVRNRVNDAVRGVQDASRAAYNTADQAVRDGIQYARNNPRQTAMYAAGAVGAAGLAFAGAKVMGSAGISAAAGQAARSGWAAAQKAWNGLNQTAASSHERQAPAREPAGAFRQSHQATVNQPTFSFGVRAADARTAPLDLGRSSSGARSTVGDRVSGLNGPNSQRPGEDRSRPGADASKGLFENDSKRSWASYGAKAVGALSTQQGRQGLIDEVGQKTWGAAQSWTGQAANANTPAKQPQQMERPALPERNRDMAALSR